MFLKYIQFNELSGHPFPPISPLNRGPTVFMYHTTQYYLPDDRIVTADCHENFRFHEHLWGIAVLLI
jgi:hypothetical protein